MNDPLEIANAQLHMYGYTSIRNVDLDALNSEIDKLKTEHDAEVDEFNAGYDAARRGEPIDNDTNHPYDQWAIGWVWAHYDRAKEEFHLVIDA